MYDLPSHVELMVALEERLLLVEDLLPGDLGKVTGHPGQGSV